MSTNDYRFLYQNETECFIMMSCLTIHIKYFNNYLKSFKFNLSMEIIKLIFYKRLVAKVYHLSSKDICETNQEGFLWYHDHYDHHLVVEQSFLSNFKTGYVIRNSHKIFPSYSCRLQMLVCFNVCFRSFPINT